MKSSSASYLEIEPHALARHLLCQAGQCEREYVNPRELLDFLNLKYMSFNFVRELPEEAKKAATRETTPRALLSFADRLVATDEVLDEKRSRFSVLHEIGHFVLPHHAQALIVCDDLGLSSATQIVLEKEANEFAADLLFLGDRFAVEINSRLISAKAVKDLANKYRASFEATARRLVENNFRPCMLIAFHQEPRHDAIDADLQALWSVRYCVASPTFQAPFFDNLSGLVSPEIVKVVAQPGREITDSLVREIGIKGPKGEESRFQAEFFYNTYNIFCLLTPVK